jgi:hypothetical protein
VAVTTKTDVDITSNSNILEIVGAKLKGRVNTSHDDLLLNIANAVRQQHPQARPEPVKLDRVAIVGSGVSLKHTLSDLRQMVFEGAKIVTVNGSYQWCIEHNIRPTYQVVMDARPTNARFLTPEVPGCKYWLASQCHPDTFDTVKDYEFVRIFHAANPDCMEKPLLDEYYAGHWYGVMGGTTVASRAVGLMRMLGFLRFDLFGVDSCFMGGKHHAYAQPENDTDKAHPFVVHPTGHPELARTFMCTGWHAKQLEDMLQAIRLHGDNFLMNVHGEGLLAYALKCSADVQTRWVTDAAVSSEKE